MNAVSLTVTQLNEYLRRSLASDPMLRNLCVIGEISNFKPYISGHWYFTIKDQEGAINCVMFRTANQSVRFQPKNGDRVRLRGSVSMYVKTGSVQFYAEGMEQDGLGELYLRFEELKRKLEEEGLFDPSLKKPLPLLPRGIGIVTSRSGAVIHDIMNVAGRRFPGIPLYLYSVKVQGDGAAQEICDGIRIMERFDPVDVIIVGRGGGSVEDLWPFNEEMVARCVFHCTKPVVSAVGHETDFTIIDFVSDLRAPTPSAAAELTVPLREELFGMIEEITNSMLDSVNNRLASENSRVDILRQKLKLTAPSAQCERMVHELKQKTLLIKVAMNAYLSMQTARLSRLEKIIQVSGPAQTLERGFALVRQNDRLVKKASEIDLGKQIEILMADGPVAAMPLKEEAIQ